MFDVGFSEMIVIAVVALIVIGPERLPKVARTLGHLWGRAQRYVNGIKADISRDMALEELRQMKAKVQQEAESAESAFKQSVQQVDQQMQQLHSVAHSVSEPAQATLAQPAAKMPEQQKFPID